MYPHLLDSASFLEWHLEVLFLKKLNIIGLISFIMPISEDDIDHYRCPVCSSIMKPTRKRHRIARLNIGPYDAVECPVCGKYFFTSSGMDQIMEDFQLLSENRIVDLSPSVLVAETISFPATDNTRTVVPLDKEETSLKPLEVNLDSINLTHSKMPKYSEKSVVFSVDQS